MTNKRPIDDSFKSAAAALHAHDKQFRVGMDWFDNGYDRPREDSPALAGWLAAQEMKSVKARYLEASRDQFVGTI